MTPESFAALAEELDAVEDVLLALQRLCDERGATPVMLAPHDAPNVHHLRPVVAALPGPDWQALEAIRGLAWVVGRLCEEVQKGAAQ